MVGIPLVLVSVLVIVVMFLVLLKTRLHPFLAIMGVSVVFGITVGNIPLTYIPRVIGAGFSGIFTSIGIVIIFGVIIGTSLEASGAGMKIASMLIRFIGRKSPTLSFMIMGWVVSLSVYCDSGFVVLNPLRKSLVKCTGVSGIATGVGLGTGLYVSHVLVPFAPGPLLSAYGLGFGDNMLLVLLVATVVSIPALVGAYFYAIYIGKRKRSKEDLKVIRHDTVKSYGHMIARHKKLPNGLLSLSPILAPILLMVLSAIVDVTDWTGWGRSLVDFMGHPIMALAAGVFFAVLLLVLTKKAKDFNPITETTLKTAGPILCVTAASGVLGNIIANTITHSVCDYTYPEMVGFIAGNTGAMHGLGLFFPFLLAALIKTAQGSSTIAMVTTAGVMNPLMAVLGLDSVMMTALTIMAIGAGSMLISHANDSYFWVVAKLSGMSPRQAYASHTVTTAIAGVCCMVGVFVFSLFVS